MPGYYLIDGLSIELEYGLMAVEDSRPFHSIIGNLSYTYPLPESSVALFARAGYGVSNGRALYSVIMSGGGEMDYGILNLGAGAKILLSRMAYLRGEVNYRSYSKSDSDEFGESTYTLSHIALLFGLGIVL
jgi:hypothetical protein